MAATVGENLFIGTQVAYWRRRRGKSQRVLADLAGMSQPYLSQIERGRRPVDRRATLVALANALRVSVADLTGQPGDPTDPAQAAAVPRIREALIQREVGEVGESRLDVGEALRAGEAYDFAALVPMLPDLLGGVRGPGLIQVAHVASYTLRDLGYPDLGRDAARLARMAFGPTNVGFWTVALHLELGEPELALEAAARLTPERVPLASRQGPFHADVATALAAVGRDDEAIATFLRSEAAGPQWFRLRPTVRDTIGTIIRRTRRNAISKQMRHAAVAANLHHLVKD